MATLKDLSITWTYWLSISVFVVFAVLGGWLILTGDESNNPIGYICCGLFVLFALCGLMWPVLRTRERHGITIEYVRTASVDCHATLLPASRVKNLIGLFSSLLIAITGILLFVLADSWEYRVKSCLVAICFLIVFGWLLKDSFGPRHGILLRPDGLEWREYFRAPYFVPWTEIESVGMFAKPQQYTKPIPCFGLTVKDCCRVQTSNRSRKKLVSDYAIHGAHLHIEAESLLVPLSILSFAIQFYRDHPEKRMELGTSHATARLEQCCE